MPTNPKVRHSVYDTISLGTHLKDRKQKLGLIFFFFNARAHSSVIYENQTVKTTQMNEQAKRSMDTQWFMSQPSGTGAFCPVLQHE